jgi:hypothetical protein
VGAAAFAVSNLSKPQRGSADTGAPTLSTKLCASLQLLIAEQRYGSYAKGAFKESEILHRRRLCVATRVYALKKFSRLGHSSYCRWRIRCLTYSKLLSPKICWDPLLQRFVTYCVSRHRALLLRRSFHIGIQHATSFVASRVFSPPQETRDRVAVVDHESRKSVCIPRPTERQSY